MPDQSLQVPEELVPLIKRLAAHARSGVWGDFSFRLEGGRVVGKLKAALTEELEGGAAMPTGGGPPRR